MFTSNSLSGNDDISYADSILSNGYSLMDDASSQHLFTCDLDGKELKNIADCVERLKLLDGIGRVWGQSMLLEVRGPKLLLTDIETKEELESMALGDILELKAVLDSGVWSSLLTVAVQQEREHTAVFMFQCEDIRADYVQKNLSLALSRKKADSSVSFFVDMDEADTPEPELFVHMEMQEEEEEEEEEQQFFTTEEEDVPPPRRYTEVDRNVDILNHILGDIEIFIGQVSAVVAKNAKKKKKKKKKKGKAVDGMPSAEEFVTCLQKIKFGFNLLVVSHCPEDLPMTIVAPLLIPQAIRLMSEEASAEEDQLWQSLGDAWNIPSTKWPEDDEDIPTFTPEFFDGWQPPEVSATPEPRQPVIRRRQSPKPGPSKVNHHTKPPPVQPPAPKWKPQNPPRPREPQYMRVMTDFISRNDRELTVRAGDTVDLLDKSKQWWKVRDSRGDEGYVPNNVLRVDTNDEQPIQHCALSGRVERLHAPEYDQRGTEDSVPRRRRASLLPVTSSKVRTGCCQLNETDSARSKRRRGGNKSPETKCCEQTGLSHE
ncbi:Epidermal growth factor receptor kinase substrate 8-like protein 3 [Collichthys lucidus]|uniref:Epidermal growth factor receptor kinase substrate 8-like protein 3 n=1 Tax=Collichthys lucidus TaxID=240159 RepID=A0A4U5UBE2_COLLU|nr:Epidermal growth factor receptor kinase substrate 8-like protein 3 [Collichthys lucidus]